MAIRIPGKPGVGASEIRKRDTDKVYSISRIFCADGDHNVSLMWEQTTFVDCNGKAFYDCNGIPFQGKKG